MDEELCDWMGLLRTTSAMCDLWVEEIAKEIIARTTHLCTCGFVKDSNDFVNEVSI